MDKVGQMSYFPFFIDLEGKEGLVIGGGSVALRKVEKLLPYGPQPPVIAPEILPEIKKYEGISCMEIPFTASALEGKSFVIAASDHMQVNHEAAHLCRERGILVNVVDDKEACTFLFPALVKRGELSVGISTGGASPSAAVYVKEQIDRLLPEDFGEIRDELAALRPLVMEKAAKDRGAIFQKLFEHRLKAGVPLEEEVLRRILEGEEG